MDYRENPIPVGVHTHDKESFVNHYIHLQKGDTFYIFSDGYTSQFGGAEGKKFNSKTFKDLILGMHSQSMPVQKLAFEKTLVDWQGKCQQVDDISIVGVMV
jgi:serine phosphatase RsbU (regulator of sigma subunit)